MLSEQLGNRVLFQWREDRKLDREAQDLINRAVRRLVLLMRAYEVHGVGSRDAIESAVLRAFEASELAYYALDEDELMAIIRLEGENARNRSKARR